MRFINQKTQIVNALEKKALVDINLDLINPEKHNNRDLYNITQFQTNPLFYMQSAE